MMPLHYAIIAALGLGTICAVQALGFWPVLLAYGLAWAAIIGPAMARWAWDYWRAGGWFRSCVLTDGPVLAVVVLGPAGVWL